MGRTVPVVSAGTHRDPWCGFNTSTSEACPFAVTGVGCQLSTSVSQARCDDVAVASAGARSADIRHADAIAEFIWFAVEVRLASKILADSTASFIQFASLELSAVNLLATEWITPSLITVDNTCETGLAIDIKARVSGASITQTGAIG